MVKIFDIKDKQVVINPEILLIPELKAVVDKYEDSIKALSFLYFLLSPDSAYINIPEDEREAFLKREYYGTYSTQDTEMIQAREKLELLWLSPTIRYFKQVKKALEKLGSYLENTEISEGRDGNLAQFRQAIKDAGQLIQQFKQLEKAVEEEILKMKGNAKRAYDDID